MNLGQHAGLVVFWCDDLPFKRFGDAQEGATATDRNAQIEGEARPGRDG
jgi:hypothetical protein